MTEKAGEHQRLILEQFTKQAVPFSQMQNHSPELLLAASGVGPADAVLDVACGPGLMACAFAKVARHVTGTQWNGFLFFGCAAPGTEERSHGRK